MRDDLENNIAVIARRGDVEEAQLVGAFTIVNPRLFDRIASIDQIDEIDALDHPPAFDVEARYDADLKHYAANSASAAAGSMRPS